MVTPLLTLTSSADLLRQNATTRGPPRSTNVLMSGNDYRESLRRYRPKVYVNGHQVRSVADEPLLAPGVNALALTYDYALREEFAPLMRAETGNRMLAVPMDQDLLNKLEAVRLICQQTGCAQRYLAGDAFSAILSATHQTDADLQTDYGDRFSAYLKQAWSDDLAIGIAMTDAKGDRTERPAAQRTRTPICTSPPVATTASSCEARRRS